MWDFLSNLGGAIKRPFTELPKGKMLDLGAVKPTLAGGASAGPQGPPPIPTNDARLNVPKPTYQGAQHPDFVPNIGMPGPARQPWSQEGAARNDWMMERGERTPGAPGSVLGRDAQTGQEYGGGQWTGKIKRDWKDMAANALLGYGQAYNESGGNAWAGLGGAIGGGAGTAISPEYGRNYSFDRTQRPRILEDEARQAQMSQLGMDQEMQRARIDEIRARGQESAEMAPLERDRMRAQTESMRATAGMKDPEMARAFQQSRIELNEARAEAAKTGKPVIRDVYDPETKGYKTIGVYPNGEIMEVGEAARPQMNRENINSREKISASRDANMIRRTAMAQAGATGRTMISQKGQDARLNTRLGAEGGGAQAKIATPAMIQKFAAEKKITVEQAKERARKEGFQVQ